MKKLNLAALLLGAALFTGLGVVSLSASSKLDSDSEKCCKGKFDDAKNAPAKKCGDAKKAPAKTMKCGAGKCGKAKKAPAKTMKCGAGKCGAGKCGTK
jgi:uncharacterized low-complexity protein